MENKGIGYKIQTMTSRIDLEAQYCAQNYKPLPVVLTRAEGVHVWDDAGKKYLDMMSAYSAVSHGHANPRLVKLVQEQVAQLNIVSRAFYTDKLGPFLEKICSLMICPETSIGRLSPMTVIKGKMALRPA